MREVLIQTIKPAEQRYQTVGDWYNDGDQTVIRVSDTGDPDHSFLVAVHELVEWYLCQKAGISAAAVDEFDHRELREPYLEHGDMPDAPYHRQHDAALCVERVLAHELGIDWQMYEERLDEVLKLAPND